MWDFLAIAGFQRAGARRTSDMNPHAVPIEKIPRKIPQTNPTPPDESDTTGQVFFQIRMNPAPRDHSDRLQPPHNPPVVGSIPTGPTMPYDAPYLLIAGGGSYCLQATFFSRARDFRRSLIASIKEELD
jgi:hypothetical protein